MSDAKIMGLTLGSCAVALVIFLVVWFTPSGQTDEPMATTKPMIAAVSPANSRKVPATTVAATRPIARVITIHGGAWLNRNDGGSDLLRGLSVSVVPQIIKAPKLKAAMEVYAVLSDHNLNTAKKNYDQYQEANASQFSDEMVEVLTKSSAWARSAVSHGDVVPTSDVLAMQKRMIADQMSVVPLYQRRRDAIRGKGWSFLEQLAQIDVDHARSMAVATIFDAPLRSIAESAVEQTKTGIDGKFSIIASVTESPVFMFAHVDTPQVMMAWLIPIEPGAKVPLSIDLDNSNAIVVWNK